MPGMTPNVQIEGLRAFAQSLSNAGLERLSACIEDKCGETCDSGNGLKLCAFTPASSDVSGEVFADSEMHYSFSPLHPLRQ